MTDDPLDREDTPIDASTYLDWLDEMARSEGKTREELLETLVTSYWTLDEMFRLMEQADPDSDLSISIGRDEPLPPADGREDRIENLEKALLERIDDLDHRFSYLRDDLTRLDGTSDRELAQELDSLRERVEGLERTIADEGDSTTTGDGAVDSLADRLETVEDAISTRHESLRERVDTEFGHLRTILEHLLGATDELDGRTRRIEERYDHLLQSDHDLRVLRANLDRLTELKRMAARMGVSGAKCAYCDTSVDVALLPTPHCPQCDRTFDGIEPKRGWFGSPTLTVTDEPLVEERSSRRSRTRTARDAGERGGDADEGHPQRNAETVDNDSIGGFEWGGETR